MITAAHVQQVFAREHVALRRFATSPSVCDASACASMEIWGARFAYLAPRARGDYMVVVLPTLADAKRFARVQPALGARRTQNVLLLYSRAAGAKLRTALAAFAKIRP